MASIHTLQRSASRGRAPRWIRALCATLPFALAPAGFAASEPSLITGQKKSYGYSWQQEMKLGAEADKEITQSMGLYDNPQLQAYVEAVGQRVLQQTQFNDPRAPAIYKDTKFAFRVIDSPVVNAFALPGGYVYVTRGLLSHVQNEAQLAVVLGHEIGHVAARHSSQQARRSQWTQLGVIAGAVLGQKVLGDKAADIGPAILQAGGQAAQLFLLRYSRDAENEADQLGMNYAMRTGYAGEQSARFFESLQRLSAAEGKMLPTWQSTHPDPGNRAQHVLQLAQAVPAELRTNVGEEEYLKHIEGIVVGDNPREGFARNGVFYHPELRFQLPVAPGWKLDNQRAAVVMAEPNGRAMMGLKLAPGSRAREAAAQFAQQSKVQVVASGDTAVNGLPTTVIIGQGNTEDGAVGVWDAFIEMDGKVYSLLGYAPQQVFDQMRPTFESVAAGFSPLRDERMAAVQPSHLKLVRADRSAPFASFVPTALPQEITADHVALMNQVTLNDPVNQGRLLKIPDTAPPPPTPASAVETQPRSPYPVYGQPQNYPGNPPPAPQSYPPQTTYPQQPPYPTYPPQNYPQQPSTTYPPPQGSPQNYPPSGSYPSQPNYPQYPPQSSTSYPPSSYPQPPPATNYPPPQNYPQFPQPGTPANNRNPQPSQPTWPR